MMKVSLKSHRSKKIKQWNNLPQLITLWLHKKRKRKAKSLSLMKRRKVGDSRIMSLSFPVSQITILIDNMKSVLEKLLVSLFAITPVSTWR